ncbi:MAG: GNAT family N-acetyltransferase [Vitreoscilla sp.]|nr:GNAT family N-acetyltransferase [Vitreoscilla sp.]
MIEPEPVPRTEWPALGAFIFRNNRTADGRVRCLHGDQGGDERSHVAALAELPEGEAAFWRAVGSRGETLGVIGCEIDRSQQRAWIRGPWAVPGLSSASLEAVLLNTLERALPEINHLDAFPSEDDATLAALYRGAGYCWMDIHRVMQAALGDAGTLTAADPRIRPARSDDLRLWLPLHRGLFPGSYLSDDEIAAAISDGPRLVLTALLDGWPAGYLVAKDDPTGDELYVDYLGVDPAARGRGLGRALLQHAMSWGEDRGRRRAALTVRQDRAEALSLYLQCGFQQARAGVHWRKDRAKVAASPAAER